MVLKTLLQSQRDARWGSILIGYNTDSRYTIYSYGCLITSLGNLIGKTPAEVNQILKDNQGYVGGGNFVWAKSSVLGIKEQYVSARCQAVSLYATEVTKLREFLAQGYPALCEVDFNPATDGEEMHFVLAVGYTDTEIIVCDPWEGALETWTDAAFKRNTYQFRVYDKKLPEGGVQYVQVEATKFTELVSKSSLLDDILVMLNTTFNRDLVMADIKRLLGLEDVIREKDKLLGEKDTRIKQLEEEVAEVSKQVAEEKKHNEEIELHAMTLTQEVQKSQQTIDVMSLTIERLEKAIQDLQKPIEEYNGFKKWLIKLLGLG